MNNAAEIIEQFERKKANLRCSVCGHQTFGLIVSDDGDLKTYIELTQPEETPVKLRTVSTVCGNCGHIEQFLFDTLMGRALGDTP